MIEIVYANPNISKKDADDLVEAGRARRQKLFDQVLTNAKKLEGEKRSNYISSCIPFLTMF